MDLDEPIPTEELEETMLIPSDSSRISADCSFSKASGGTFEPLPFLGDKSILSEEFCETKPEIEHPLNPNAEHFVKPDKISSSPSEPSQKRPRFEIPASDRGIQLKPEPGFGINRAASIRDLDVSPRVLEILLRNLGGKLTIPTLLVSMKTDLRLMGLTSAEADDLLRQVATISCGRNYCARTMAALSQACTGRGWLQTFSCPVLDKFFRGGLYVRHLVEFAGAAGTGKTQFCLQLSLASQLPLECGGLGGECLYLNTETSFPSRRLKQISGAWIDRPSGLGRESPPSMDSIFVENLDTLAKVEAFLVERIHILLAVRPIKLLIIDSVANIFRFREEESTSFEKRAKDIQQLGNLLRGLQNRYGLLVVCTNQVSALIDGPEPSANGCSADAVVPALGISWANFVTSRVMLFKAYQPNSTGDAAIIRRSMNVMFAPHLPSEHQRFEVTTMGVFGLR